MALPLRLWLSWCDALTLCSSKGTLVDVVDDILETLRRGIGRLLTLSGILGSAMFPEALCNCFANYGIADSKNHSSLNTAGNICDHNHPL